jgi:hypothetical protein
MQKAGQSSYYELVTEKNAYFEKAEADAREKSNFISQQTFLQRGLQENPLENVDNGISIFNGLNYDKLPHILNWNTNNLKNGVVKARPINAV